MTMRKKELVLRSLLGVVAIVMTLLITNLFVPSTLEDPVTPVSYYFPPRFAINSDNNVDADSDVDASTNVGDDGADSYLNAQTKNADYQVITEGQGTGYVAATDTEDFMDAITDSQSPTDLGTYSDWTEMQDSDLVFNTLTEEDTGGGGGSVTVENSYTATGKKTSSNTISNVIVPTISDRAIYLHAAAVTKASEDAKFISSIARDGQSFSMLGEAQNVQATSSIWYLLNPNQNTADVVVTWDSSSSNWEGYTITVEVLSGVDVGGTPHDSWETPSEGSSTSATHSVATASGDLVYGVVSIDGSSSLTENGDGTEIYQASASGNQRGAIVKFTADDASSALSYSIGATEPWVFAGVSINPAGGGGSNYEFDREFSFSSLDFNDANEELAIRTGTIGTESLKIDVWDSAAWTNIVTIVDANDNTWINTSISSYLDASAEYFRFLGNTESSDTTQNTWQIDSVMIHSWNDATNDYELDWEHQAQSVPTGSDNYYSLTIFGSSTEDMDVYMWNTSDSTWNATKLLTVSSTEQWYNASITGTGLTGATMTWNYRDINRALDSTQSTLSIDFAGIWVYSIDVNISDTALTVTALPDASDTAFNEFSEAILTDSGVEFHIEVKCIDWVGTPCTSNYLWFDNDSNPAGYIQLTTSYTRVYWSQTSSITSVNLWLWVNLPTGIPTQDFKFNLTARILVA